MMYKGPLFSTKTFDILGIQLTTMLCLFVILCESEHQDWWPHQMKV
jgi:hypothetical protein